MLKSLNKTCLIKLLIVLELVNFQVVTILLNDFILFKFARDILLALLVFNEVAYLYKKEKDFKINSLFNIIKSNQIYFCFFILIIFILLACLRTYSFLAIFVFVRKYLSPIILFILVMNLKKVDDVEFNSIIRFIFNLLFVLSLWGIIQAHLIGPKFLVNIGYPLKYSDRLKDSFFFGNLGIQRVVSTLSNSNVFALILGTTIITLIFNFKEIIKDKLDWFKFATICIAYLLTFSRANWLAFMFVIMFKLWKYIPYKKYLYYMIGACFALFAIVYFIQDENGITHQLFNWVVSSLTFKESSAAGRLGIWMIALNNVIRNPLGIGFGRVGSWPLTVGMTSTISSENSYLAIALDLGWLGLFAYICFIIAIFKMAIHKIEFSVKNSNTIITLLMYLLFNFMFSNHIYDKEALMYILFIISLNICVIINKKNSEGRLL